MGCRLLSWPSTLKHGGAVLSLPLWRCGNSGLEQHTSLALTAESALFKLYGGAKETFKQAQAERRGVTGEEVCGACSQKGASQVLCKPSQFLP